MSGCSYDRLCSKSSYLQKSKPQPIANLSQRDSLLQAGAVGAALRKGESRPMRIDPKSLEPISSRLLEKGINLSLEAVCAVTDLRGVGTTLLGS